VRVPPELPHVYPFRFVETVLEPRDADFSRGTVSVSVSANDRAAGGEGWQSPLLLAEAIAQSALLLEGGDAGAGRTGFLVGLDGFEVKRPPRAGEMLEVRVRLSARFGAIVKFDGEVSCGAETLARGSVLVRKSAPPSTR
jgi:3-hydroxymyristoyl/3-hydroxydecanoyl-(acyl carrier protein) dehydratase